MMTVFCFQYYSILKAVSKYIQVSIAIRKEISEFFGINFLLSAAHYKPFDAPGWKIRDAGWQGQVAVKEF
jgi:hypothetical protein